MSTIKYQYKGKFNPEILPIDCIDRLSTAMIPKNSKVLELGCATGFMSQYLVEQKKCSVVGAELDKKAAQKAEKYCQKVVTGNLEDPAVWQQIGRYKPFDVVFASAILEHLRDPWETLKQISKVLKNKGILVITLPNIAHWRMRLDLLRGNWQYQQYGILDNTHLRFFSYDTMQELVSTAGFSIQEIAIDPAGGIKYFNHIAKYFPNFYAHQVAIKAQKN